MDGFLGNSSSPSLHSVDATFVLLRRRKPSISSFKASIFCFVAFFTFCSIFLQLEPHSSA